MVFSKKKEEVSLESQVEALVENLKQNTNDIGAQRAKALSVFSMAIVDLEDANKLVDNNIALIDSQIETLKTIKNHLEEEGKANVHVITKLKELIG